MAHLDRDYLTLGAEANFCVICRQVHSLDSHHSTGCYDMHCYALLCYMHWHVLLCTVMLWHMQLQIHYLDVTVHFCDGWKDLHCNGVYLHSIAPSCKLLHTKLHNALMHTFALYCTKLQTVANCCTPSCIMHNPLMHTFALYCTKLHNPLWCKLLHKVALLCSIKILYAP